MTRPRRARAVPWRCDGAPAWAVLLDDRRFVVVQRWEFADRVATLLNTLEAWEIDQLLAELHIGTTTTASV